MTLYFQSLFLSEKQAFSYKWISFFARACYNIMLFEILSETIKELYEYN